MCHFVGTSRYFSTTRPTFSDGHGAVADEDRKWEDGYRLRWQQDKIVRSTHGVNCTGSCSWEVYVKGGIVTWETRQTDYPRTRPDMPNHEPRTTNHEPRTTNHEPRTTNRAASRLLGFSASRLLGFSASRLLGFSRSASYSCYLYSANS